MKSENREVNILSYAFKMRQDYLSTIYLGKKCLPEVTFDR